jgi:hypothetical protein
MAFSQIHKLLQSVQSSTEIQRGLRPAKVLRQIPQPRPPDELQLAPIMTLTIVAWVWGEITHFINMIKSSVLHDST